MLKTGDTAFFNGLEEVIITQIIVGGSEPWVIAIGSGLSNEGIEYHYRAMKFSLTPRQTHEVAQ